jgi:hypothetical protein
MRNSRLALALNGVIMILLGMAFWFRPEFFTLAMFPEAVNNDEALNLGIALRKNMGVGCVFIGMLLFWCQTSSRTTAQRLLLGSGFGFALMVAGLLEVRLTRQADVPILIILAFTLMSLHSFFVATRRYQE